MSSNTPKPKRIYLGKFIVLAVIAVLAGILVPYWYITNQSRDEQQIKNLISDLAENLSRTPQESTATALIKVKSIADAFTDPMTLAMDKYATGIYSRDRFFASLSRYRALVGEAQVAAADITVELTGKESARGYFSGSFSGKLKSGLSDKIVKDIDAEFVKINGKWKIKKLKFTNVLH